VEGERYLGTITNVSDGNSALIGTLPGITLAVGEFVTLITTDANGNSSEFSTYAMAMDGDSDGMSPEDIKTTVTTAGGLSINADGGNDIYLLADNGDALLGGQSVLSFETQFSALPGSGDLTLLSYAVPDNSNEVNVEIQASGAAKFHVAGTSYTSTAINYNTMRDGSTHSMGFSWDGSTGNWAIYADGVLVDSTAISGGTLLANGRTIEGGGALLFGQEQDSVEGGFSDTQEFSGTLFNTRFFSDVRTAAEMSVSHRRELPHDEAGMLAQWTFDELSVDGVITDTVSGNNLTIRHTSDVGFTPSEASLTFVVDENAVDGTVVGSVSGVDPQREARISALLTADTDLRYSAETAKFYKTVSTVADLATAQANAASITLDGVAGQLLTIRSATEQQLAESFASIAGGDIWLGATDATVEGEWRWLAGVSEEDQFWQCEDDGFSPGGVYSNWSAGRPDSGSGNEDAAKLRVSDGLWDDYQSGDTARYIVEWDADTVLDATQSLTYAITLQSVAGAFSIDSDTGELRVLNGSLLDADTLDAHTLTVEVTDIDFNTYDDVFTISLNDLAEAEQTVPSAQSVNEDATLTFINGTATEVSVSDTLGADNLMQVALSVNNGALKLSSLAGITIIEGADNSSSIIFNGTESDINTAFDGMTFTPDANFAGSVTLNMTTALAVDLEGHYTFDADANDQSAGTTYDGTLNSGAAIVGDADRGQVLSLDGAGDFVQIDSLMGEPADVTLSAWINASSVDSFGSVVISMGTSPALYLETDGTLTGFYESGATDNLTRSTESLLGTGWRHVAVSIDAANSMTMYIDGVAVDAITPVGVIEYDNSPDTYIGRAGDGLGSFDFEGMIDDARVYSRALTPDEIAALAKDQTEASDNVAITVDAVNDAPVLDNTGTMTFTPVTEDEINNAGQTVASVISSAGGDRITDVEGEPEGIAVTSHNPSSVNGPFEFSLDGGSSRHDGRHINKR